MQGSLSYNADDESYKRIVLDEAGTCWVTVSHLPGDLKEYARASYDAMWDQHPAVRSKVISFQKEVDAHRWYKSYMNTPKLDPEFLQDNKCSYMFSGFHEAGSPALPAEFAPILQAINGSASRGAQYNQAVVNWYESGADYLPFHRDWEYGKARDSDIAVVTLNQTDDGSRTFGIKPARHVDDHLYTHIDILATHGSVIVMGGDTQNKFRHGVPKSEGKASRISVTFRSFCDE